MPRHLPIATSRGSLDRSQRRTVIHPADVRGRFDRLRTIVFGTLLAAFVVLPFVRIDGRPALFLDVPARTFHLFGAVLNAQDFWLAFFVISGAGFALVVLTTLFGRVWCGYACPQTVFLEGVYRRIERWIEGPRTERMRRDAARWRWDTIARKGVKHGLYVLLSALFAHLFLSYFVSLPSLVQMMREPPSSHPAAFGWIVAVSAAFYVDFGFLREQICVVLCPYGRIQSALTDADTWVVGYDARRGEPRGKAHDEGKGDCVDCKRCVLVCPTGIDIREGLQLECIGCARCVDACDDVMEKLGRPKGLVRYDSLRGLSGEPSRLLRPRVWLYVGLGLIGLLIAMLAVRSRTPFEANLLRVSGSPYVTEGEVVRNALEIHVVNKYPAPTRYRFEVGEGELTYTLPVRAIRLESMRDTRIPVFVSAPTDALGSGGLAIEVRVVPEERPGDARTVRAPFLGPERRAPR